jgi:hypothetical protein
MIEVISAGPKTDWSLFFNKKTLTVLPTIAMSINPEKGLWIEAAWLGVSAGVTCK